VQFQFSHTQHHDLFKNGVHVGCEYMPVVNVDVDVDGQMENRMDSGKIHAAE